MDVLIQYANGVVRFEFEAVLFHERPPPPSATSLTHLSKHHGMNSIPPSLLAAASVRTHDLHHTTPAPSVQIELHNLPIRLACIITNLCLLPVMLNDSEQHRP